MKELEMRLMNKNNLDELRGVEVAEDQREYTSFPDSLYSFNLSDWRVELSVVVGFFVDNDAIGYATIGWNREYDISAFAIDKNFQNQGYGTIALAKMVDYIKTQPLGPSNRVCLSADLDNYQAIHVYEKSGFIETDDFYQDSYVKELSYFFELPDELIQNKLSLRAPIVENASILDCWHSERWCNGWLYTTCPFFDQLYIASHVDEASFVRAIEAGTYLSFPNIMYSIYYEYAHIGFVMLQKELSLFDKSVRTVSIKLAIPYDELRGRGYGFNICKKLIKTIREKGVNGEHYSHIYTEALSYNTAAIKLAEKLGFREITRMEVYTQVEQEIYRHKEQIERVVGAIEGPYEAIKFRLDF